MVYEKTAEDVTKIGCQKRAYIKHKHPETEPKPFKRAYSKLSNDDKNIAREIIMRRGKITNLTNFNQMKLGKHPINIERQDVIVSIFKAMGIDAWTGECFESVK